MKIFLFFLTLNLLSYQAKVIFVDNNFKNLKENSIQKVIYLSSKIAFDIKKGKTFNLYRNIEQDILENSGEYIDINKESDKKDSIIKKKVCVIVLEVTSVVDTLIKAVELKHCENNTLKKSVIVKNEVLGEFQKSKVGDFIEIKTIFDKKNKEKLSQNRLTEAFASIYMLGIDNDFNYLLESGINKINKKTDKKGEKDENLSSLDKPKNSNGVKKKKLPRKKKKKKKRKSNFENIRL